MILPRIKKYKPREGSFVFGRELRLSAAGDFTGCAVNLLGEFCREQDLSLRLTDEHPHVVLRCVPGLGAERYALRITPERAEISFSDAGGAVSGAASLVNLLAVTPVPADETRPRVNRLFRAECCEAEDWPDSRYRGCMLDVARRYLPLEELYRRVRELALSKYNVLHLHLLDTERYALYSQALPALNDRPMFRQYTADELRALDRYAAGLGISVIPEIDLPGHGLFLLDACPELRCVKAGAPVGIWDACVANEKLYEYVDLLIGELAGIFGCEYVHIGGDELCFYDIEGSGYWMNWQECDACSALAAREGLGDASDFFTYFVKRVHAIAARQGKKLMIWNDSVDISRPTDLPRDILVQFWRVALPTRGPSAGCSMQRWLEEGFTVVNSFYEETYIDDYVEEERLAGWNPRTSPLVDPSRAGQIAGGEMCAWGTRDHFTYTLPEAIPLFGDRLWNAEPLPRGDALTAALTRQVVSREEGYPDVFRALGGALLPLYGRNKFFPAGAVTAEEIDACITRVRRTISGGWCDKEVLTEFIRCLEDAKKHYTEGLPEPEHKGDA